MKEKKRYCKLCGSLIDNNTKKCTNCGKQYFKYKLFRNYILIAIISIIVTATTVYLIFLGNYNSNYFEHSLSYCESSVGIGSKNLAYIGKPNTNYYIKVYLVNSKEDTLLSTYTILSNFDGYFNLNLKVTEKGIHKVLVFEQNGDDYICTYFTVE